MEASVLVVDEQGADMDRIIRVLERLASVHVARSASDALEVVATLAPDLIVTPFPAVTWEGDHLTGRLKQDPRTAAVCVVAYSAWCWPRTRRKAAESGCDAFLKPSDPEDVLLETLKPMLARRAPVAPPAARR